MSQERLVIVYVGDAETEAWLAANVGADCVYRAEALLQALGMVVTYMPELVILDARVMPDVARQVYYHLQTIDAEPILVLDHSAEGWDLPLQSRVRVLTDQTDLLEEIGTLDTVGEGAYYE